MYILAPWLSPHGTEKKEKKERKKKGKKREKKGKKKSLGENKNVKRLKKTSAIHYLVYDPPVLQRQVGAGLTLTANRTRRATRISAPNPRGS